MNKLFGLHSANIDFHNRILHLENTNFKVLYYVEINGGATSGQISIPEGSEILFDQWPGGVDAVVSTITNGLPDYKETGVDVDSLDSSGNYTLSGTLSTNPAAFICYLKVPRIYLNNLVLSQIIEYIDIPLDAWEDVNIDPTTIYNSAGANPDIITIPGTNLKVASFSNVILEEVNSGFEVPHAAKLGEPISFHAHWSPTNTNTGVVRWGLEYAFFREDGSPVTSSTTVYFEDAASGVAWQRQSFAFPDIPVPVNELGLQFSFRFFRDATNVNDTYTDNAAITRTIGAHILLDSNGSNERVEKF